MHENVITMTQVGSNQQQDEACTYWKRQIK